MNPQKNPHYIDLLKYLQMKNKCKIVIVIAISTGEALSSGTTSYHELPIDLHAIKCHMISINLLLKFLEQI